jgi:ketosteroid isomerase-like protein
MFRIRNVTPLAWGLALTIAACQQQATETGEMEEAADSGMAVSAEAQLDSLRMSYEAAWNAGDMQAISGMMTSSYEEVGPEGKMNYDQAMAMMSDSANMPPPGATLSIDMESMEVAESGDVAYASGTSTVTVPGTGGAEGMSETTRWVAGFRKEGGQWKVDRLAFAPMTGAPAADGAADTTGTM